MLKFRPIAPKPPLIGSVSDRAEAAPIMKRRRGRTKPKKITIVTVEKVTEAVGSEIKRRLEAEASSPCFVTDYAGRVTWMNAGFRRMVLCDESEVVTRGTFPGGECGGFTCVARVRRSGKVVMVAPCDVWRVVEEEELGKWAWRLDVATALRLGLGSTEL